MKKQQEAAEKEAQKLIKNFKEIQKKADKKSKKKEKDIEQEIKKMEVCNSLHLWVRAFFVFGQKERHTRDEYKFGMN